MFLLPDPLFPHHTHRSRMIEGHRVDGRTSIGAEDHNRSEGVELSPGRLPRGGGMRPNPIGNWNVGNHQACGPSQLKRGSWRQGSHRRED